MKRLLERAWPWIAALIVSAAWARSGKPMPADADTLFGTAATVASIFASFLGVAQAIIIGLREGPVYKVLEEGKLLSLLFGYLQAAIFSSVAFAGLSILGFFLPVGEVAQNRVVEIFMIIWVAAGALALFTFFRITQLFFRLLNQEESSF